MVQSGGDADLGLHSGAWETFWDIRARQPQSWPKGRGPDLMNLIGVQSDGKSDTSAAGRWFEAIDLPQLCPARLYPARLARRLETSRFRDLP
jgi:hypothetical protein